MRIQYSTSAKEALCSEFKKPVPLLLDCGINPSIILPRAVEESNYDVVEDLLQMDLSIESRDHGLAHLSSSKHRDKYHWESAERVAANRSKDILC